METFIILRSKTDDALELFVKAHVLLEFKMKEVEKLKKKQTELANIYDAMSMRDANFLIANQGKMEHIMFKMGEIHSKYMYLKQEEHSLEKKCREAEEELRLARAAEREYVATILKNEKTE